MSIADFISELEQSYEGCEPGSLRPDTRFRDLPFWDSLAVLTTLAAFDTCFNRQISSDDLKKCETIEDIFNLA